MSPRANASTEEILGAAIELIAENGISGVTVDAVAASAGVGKATIYRHWGSRTNLIRAAIASMYEPTVDPDAGSLREDLAELLRDLVRFLNREDSGRVSPSFLEAAARDPDLSSLSREIARERRTAYERVIRAGIARGELPEDVDIRLLTDVLISPFLARRMVEHDRARATDIGPLIDVAIAGFRHMAALGGVG